MHKFSCTHNAVCMHVMCTVVTVQAIRESLPSGPVINCSNWLGLGMIANHTARYKIQEHMSLALPVNQESSRLT